MRRTVRFGDTDAAGVIQSNLGYKPPKAGKDLILTIDLELQKTAENILKDKVAGAIVVLDPNTGAVKALASKPNFDPNFFTKYLTSQEEYESI